MATMPLEVIPETGQAQPRVLIADDQTDVLEALRLLLKGHDYHTEAVTSPMALLDAIAHREFDLILMDLNYARDTTSGREGLDLLTQLQTIDDAPPVVVMTGWATVSLAVEAMQRGVGDFVEKPWVNARLLEIVKKQILIGQQRRDARRREMERIRAQSEMAHHLKEQDQEIGEARRIQEGFLPKEIPQLAGYEVAGAWQPTRVVGGDYYDVLPFGGEALGICIADVAGKGMPAAMLMSNLQAAVRGLASPSLSPEDLCARLNSLICRNIAGDRFITLFYAQLNGAARRLHYLNAGHNAPIVMHRDGSFDRLDSGGGVLGVFQMQAFAGGVQNLLAGDRVVLFTDGVTEARRPDGEEFGEARLRRLIAEKRGASALELQKAILRAAGDFCGGNWHDDATIVVIAVP
ncbi:MAG TPA: SpoIIE family protein phosphatase [Candidatus Acidoferrales bacterium]|nr:SpoIIE family protein phosphatase [Candidatus Acidoferrales bacterium]